MAPSELSYPYLRQRVEFTNSKHLNSEIGEFRVIL